MYVKGLYVIVQVVPGRVFDYMLEVLSRDADFSTANTVMMNELEVLRYHWST